MVLFDIANGAHGGLFCESDGVIYFSNPYDEGMLYSMSSDMEKVKKLSDDNVSYLNVAILIHIDISHLIIFSLILWCWRLPELCSAVSYY